MDDLLLTGGVTKTLKEESILATEVQSSKIKIIIFIFLKKKKLLGFQKNSMFTILNFFMNMFWCAMSTHIMRYIKILSFT